MRDLSLFSQPTFPIHNENFNKIYFLITFCFLHLFSFFFNYFCPSYFFELLWVVAKKLYISSIVSEVIKTISSQFIFLGEDFERSKMQIKPKQTNKTKISKH